MPVIQKEKVELLNVGKQDETSKLGMELIDAHKQISEWEKKYTALNERFSQVLADRDNLIKENARLESDIKKESDGKIEQRKVYEKALKEISELEQMNGILLNLVYILSKRELGL